MSFPLKSNRRRVNRLETDWFAVICKLLDTGLGKTIKSGVSVCSEIELDA